MKKPSQAERLLELHTRRFGGQCSLDKLTDAAIEEGIFPPDIGRETALGACRRALTALNDDGVPYAMVMRIVKRSKEKG